MEQCVIRVGNSQFMEYVGNVPSAIIMIYAQFVIILISIICVIDFIESRKDHDLLFISIMDVCNLVARSIEFFFERDINHCVCAFYYRCERG